MIYPTFEFQVTWNEKQFFQDWHSCLQNIIMFVYTMSHKIVHIPFYHLYLFSVHFQPFKVFQNLQGDCHETIPDFGVSTAILNTADVSRRWCKLNFGPLWGLVKSCHLTQRIDTRRQYFYFSIQISWNKWVGYD